MQRSSSAAGGSLAVPSLVLLLGLIPLNTACQVLGCGNEPAERSERAVILVVPESSDYEAERYGVCRDLCEAVNSQSSVEDCVITKVSKNTGPDYDPDWTYPRLVTATGGPVENAGSAGRCRWCRWCRQVQAVQVERL